MSSPFVVAGEALVDIVVPASGTTEHAPGGSPLNVAVGLARLGMPALLMTELGDDELGHLVREHVTASEVELHEAAIVPGYRTSTATAHLDEHGAATYDFDLRWSLGMHDLPRPARGLHVGSVGAALAPGRSGVQHLVEQAAQDDLLVTYDPNTRPTITPDAAQVWRDVQEIAELSTVVKLSDEDLHFLLPGVAPTDVAEHLLRGRTRLVVVTLGGAGAVAVSRSTSVQVQSGRTTVVDTVGAGDSFMAALVASVVEHGLEEDSEEWVRALVSAAHEAAAVTVGRRGANPPTRGELSPRWPNLG